MNHQGNHAEGWRYILGDCLIDRKKLSTVILDSIKRPKEDRSSIRIEFYDILDP
jgi:hypothetical protein